MEVLVVNNLCLHYKITSGTVTYGFDNKATLTNCFGPYKPLTQTLCFHIIKLIRKEIDDSPIKLFGKKVEGYQDKNKKYEELDC